MNEENEFEDWSHPTRSLSMPPRRAHVRWTWLRAVLWLTGLAIACLLFWGAWHVGHLVSEAYRVVFSS